MDDLIEQHSARLRKQGSLSSVNVDLPLKNSLHSVGVFPPAENP
jgi:hypothetical protein